MAKYFGKVGYAEQKKTAPGVWIEVITEREYTGDILINNRRLENASTLNSNLNVNNRISIVSDAYANENFFAMRYVSWMGVLWKVSNVEVQHPRLILTIGGVYHAEPDRPQD